MPSFHLGSGAVLKGIKLGGTNYIVRSSNVRAKHGRDQTRLAWPGINILHLASLLFSRPINVSWTELNCLVLLVQKHFSDSTAEKWKFLRSNISFNIPPVGGFMLNTASLPEDGTGLNFTNKIKYNISLVWLNYAAGSSNFINSR